MTNIKFNDVIGKGELAYRILKSYSRLESKWYKPDIIFSADVNGWPADWEGRTILALVMLAQAAKREPAYLDRIVDSLKFHLNRKSYMGEILPEGILDEQQLSGHNWLLRGLLELYLWKKDDSVLQLATDIVNNLYLKAIGYYKTYPTNPKDRVQKGEAAGNLTGSCIGNWKTSTDIGCAYMSLDGLTQYYSIVKDERVKQLIVEMIDTFMNIDFVEASMQTHASLSATRGIIRFYEITGEDKYLRHGITMFNLYMAEGITENYSNYNWFRRPLWTEPCAIVDSYLVAINLFKNTLNSEYLEIAQRIYYNGLGFAQRHNGGFGCDNCSGAYDQFLSSNKNLYEAYWCCTMRGADGISNVLRDVCFLDNDSLIVANYIDGTIDVSGISMVIQTKYPLEGIVNLQVEKKSYSEIRKIKLFVPANSCNNIKIFINGVEANAKVIDGFVVISISNESTEILIDFDFSITAGDIINKNSIQGYKKYWHGVLLLGVETDTAITTSNEFEYLGNGSYRDIHTDFVLKPFNTLIDMEEEQARNYQVQILF